MTRDAGRRGAPGRSPTPSSWRRCSPATRSAEQAQHQGDRHRRQPARLRPRRPATRRRSSGRWRRSRTRSASSSAPARRRRWRRSSAPSGWRPRGRRRRPRCPRTTLIVSRAQARDLPQPVLDAVLKAPVGDAAGASSASTSATRATRSRASPRSGGRDPAAADPTKAQAQYAHVWADAEAQAYYAALKSRFKVTINESALAARRRGERAVAEAGRSERGLEGVACYNRPLGGGCSSVGRVQDCDSCCRGFEPHQPPH